MTAPPPQPPPVRARTRGTFDAERELEECLAGCLDEALRILREARVDERQRVAMELHDTIAAQLAGTALVLAAAERRARPPAARHLLGEARLAVHAAAEVVRDYAGALDAPATSRDAVHAVLSEMVEELRRTGAAATLRIAPGSAELLPAAAVGQLRGFVREAASNALRHGHARHVALEVVARRGRVVVEVRDDGTGFEPGQTPPGMGLRNMRRRAAALGGRLTVRSAPGKGTRICLSIPIT